MTNFECKYKSAEKSADIFEDRNPLIFCQVLNKKDTNFHIKKYHTISFSYVQNFSQITIKTFIEYPNQD